MPRILEERGGIVLFSQLFSSISGIFYFMLYIRLQGSFEKPMSSAEEKACLQQMAAGDKDARDKLISRNLRLIAHVVKKYNAPESVQDDLLSIGTIGLIKAVDSYSLAKGSKFSTYAAKCIENEVLMYFRSQKKSAGDKSINDVIDTDKEGNELTLVDIIVGEDNIAENLEKKINIEKMVRLLGQLEEREQKVLILRYGLDNKPPRSQQETADILGISRSYISRIEKRAIEKMRKGFET